MFSQPPETHEFLAGLLDQLFVTQEAPSFPVHLSNRETGREVALREPLGEAGGRLSSQVCDEAVHPTGVGVEVLTPGRRLFRTVL